LKQVCQNKIPRKTCVAVKKEELSDKATRTGDIILLQQAKEFAKNAVEQPALESETKRQSVRRLHRSY